jgi:hypothetical protein
MTHEHLREDMDDRTMTTHLDDGRVVMLRDGDPSDAWDVTHAEGCAVCTAELDEARARATIVSDALASFDVRTDVVSAKAAVRRRLDEARAPRARALPRIPLGRAAAVLLVTAGAAAALPWSPISPWRPESVPAPEPAATTQAAPVEVAETTASVAVDVADGIEIVVRNASGGSALELVWRDDAEARVAAPRGSSFALGTGRVEVDASAGAIRIEAPRDAQIALSVNGRTYLERSAQGLTVSEPAAEVTDAGVRFLVRDP